jgi:hypothetical protein
MAHHVLYVQPRFFHFYRRFRYCVEQPFEANSVVTEPRLRMIDIAIWVIVLLLGAVVYIVWHGLQITRAQHQSTMAGLSSLGDTHKLGYEALTLAMQRLEQRVRQLEERR